MMHSENLGVYHYLKGTHISIFYAQVSLLAI